MQLYAVISHFYRPILVLLLNCVIYLKGFSPLLDMANSMKTNHLKVRKATRADIPKFMKTIVNAKAIGNCVPKTYFNWVVHDGITLVAETEQEKEKTAGFLVAERNSKAAAHVTYVYVHPKFRSKGVGSTLMDHFLGKCRSSGVKYVDLHSKMNTRGFYKKFGFKPEGKFTVMYKRI